ncbi:MAG: DNA mismatch repair protein MutS [Muribaculaceae bacterium]|nr:DNA mismatch repair protein MutS [Muribaculaceae bacterium]
MAKIVETPLMKQYFEMKKKHPDAILLFRVGDFYETFSDDAIEASSILGITLTRRANGSAQSVELAGFPHHALDTYLPKLVRAGKRVAICEQLEDPKLTKKLVKRGITELVTPGVNTNDSSMEGTENNYLAGIHFQRSGKGKPIRAGVAFLDITTGEFLATETDPAEIDKLLSAFAPKELLRMNGTRELWSELITWKCPNFDMEDWVYTEDSARERLLKQFQTATLKGFGLDDMPLALIAAGSLLYYLDITGHSNTSHITVLSRIDSERFLRMDPFTLRNLELTTSAAGAKGLTLFGVLNHTVTPMGARLLGSNLSFPLLDPKKINERHAMVDFFFRDTDRRDYTRTCLQAIGDMQRMIGKTSNRRAQPRDLLSLAASMEGCMRLKRSLSGADSPEIAKVAEEMQPLEQYIGLIRNTISPDAPALFNKGGSIASGVSKELDEYRGLHDNARAALDAICAREIERTGITSLKISYNNVFGYYIEVRNTHKDKVPAEWIRKQTLVNAERYITEELKDFEQKILTASDRIGQIESEIYGKLLDHLSQACAPMQKSANAAAEIDFILSMAEVAASNRYVRPIVDDSTSLEIIEGRHPVIERRLPPGEPYISNTVRLDCDSNQILMITGPNMSGKSALLRQTALIVIMAQMGSFVPAESARIGIVDKIFTRVGASDNLAAGESTFMVEMSEAASILNNMSQRSLILFDELGRGTSTYDGISIAWSIVEHIHENGRCTPKTLFATHYHELNEMEKSFNRIHNWSVSVKEIKGKVVFLRKLVKGGSEHSFGIHVAKLAGMPPSIVKRANQVLERLESSSSNVDNKGVDSVAKGKLGEIAGQRDGYQLSFFQLDDPLLSQIRDRILTIDIDNLTPLQSLTVLHDLKSLLTGK